MVAKVAGVRAGSVGKAANALVVGVPSEWLGPSADDIAPMAKIVGVVPLSTNDEEGTPGEVWFVCTAPGDVTIGEQIAQDAVKDGAWKGAKVRYLKAADDVAGAVGDLVGTLLRDRKRVVASDAAGTEVVRWAIRRASGNAGVPLLTFGPLGEVYVDQSRVAAPSLLLAALRFTLTETPSSTPPVELHERGFTTLVRQGGGNTYERTRLLDTLLADIDLARSSDYSSACADLLARRGFPEDAQRLRAATQYWIQQRLWDANFVPEMVLHNEAHSAAVDRNLAFLCEPLLALEKDRPIDEVDLLVLALAAWLHDWGHASVRAKQEDLVTNPIDVRNYHGLFTAALLTGKGTVDSRHEVDKRFAGVGLLRHVYPVGRDWLAKDVALLCMHHQGWTSCSAYTPVPKPPEEPALKILELHGEGIVSVKSFEEDHAAYLVGRGTAYFASRGFTSPTDVAAGHTDETGKAKDLARAYLRLALLRVADAVDVGVHRVPDYRTQREARDTIARVYLDRQEQIVRLILQGREQIARLLPQGVERQRLQESIAELGRAIGVVKGFVESAQRTVQDRTTGGSTISEAAVEGIFDGVEGRPAAEGRPAVEAQDALVHQNHWLNTGANSFEFGLESVRPLAQKAYKYARHLVAQQAFYDQHELVRAVLPSLRPSGASFDLVLHVIPNIPIGAQDAVGRSNAAVRYARSIVAREWGNTVDEDFSDGKFGNETPSGVRGDDPKRAIGDYLERLRIAPRVEGRLIVLGETKELDEFVPSPTEFSPSGSLAARPVAGGIEVRDLSAGALGFIPLTTENLTLLAVDGVVGATRAIVSVARGTALVHESDASRDRALVRTPSAAGVLLPDHGILVDAEGVALLVRLEQPQQTRPVDWLVGCRVSDLDSAVVGGEFLVVAGCAVDGNYELRAARGNPDNWRLLSTLRLHSRADRVSLTRSTDSVRVDVVLGEKSVGYSLENDEWRAE